MSHITSVKVIVKDLTALRAACQRLGFGFIEGQRSFACYGSEHGWPRDQWQCDHAISAPGARYEVGIRQEGDHYALAWDNWPAGGLKAALGEGAGKLIQAYTVEAATAEAYRQGYSVYEESLADGSVRLHVQTGESVG